MSVNKVILIGRLVREPEVRYGEKTAICKFTLAVDRPKGQKDQKSEADFINCVAWGKTGEIIGDNIGKGQRLYVEGALRTGSYTNKKGDKVYTTDIWVNSFEFIDPKGNGGSNNRRPASQGSFESFGEEVEF